jgi:hypothetical protein
MACSRKRGSMLTCDNYIIRFIQTKRQKKPGETIKETSISLIPGRVNKWPISMIARLRRRLRLRLRLRLLLLRRRRRRWWWWWWWWYGVVMADVSHCTRNCTYLTFRHKCAKYLLHIPLQPTPPISQSQAYATSTPKSQAKEYFKTILHVCRMCICIEVQSLQTCSYTGNIHPNLWNSKQCVRKLNSRYYELARTQNVRLHPTQPRQANYSIGNSSSHLFHECKKGLRFPLNNIWMKLGSLHTYRTITQATKLSTTNSHQT